MNEFIIRDLDDMIVLRLKQIAWREGKPLEEIARGLLVEAANTVRPNMIDGHPRTALMPMVQRTQARRRTPVNR